MTNDNELYDLCKQVYEATGWDNVYNYQLAHQTILITEDNRITDLPEGSVIKPPKTNWVKIPLYTTDYLLEVLPESIETDSGIYRLRGGKNQYYFWHYESKEDRDIIWWNYSPFSKEKPVIPLLKLVLELHKQGLLEVKS